MVGASKRAILSTKLRWAKVEKKVKALRKRRPNDRFLHTMLKGALAVARDPGNPIRGNLFAAAMREIVTHLLHTMGPDNKVIQCSWYVKMPNTSAPTRKQRAGYIAYAGLSPSFIDNELSLNSKAMGQSLIKSMDELNRLTHVQRQTILYKGSEVRALADEALTAILELFDAAEECRSAVERELADHLDQAVMDGLISETIDDLDELSTHTTVEGHNVESVSVIDIDHEFIWFEVDGSVDVELQYGSDSDVRNDIGMVSGDSYPYKATIQSKVTDPTTLIGETLDLSVDNSSFFE